MTMVEEKDDGHIQMPLVVCCRLDSSITSNDVPKSRLRRVPGGLGEVNMQTPALFPPALTLSRTLTSENSHYIVSETFVQDSPFG